MVESITDLLAIGTPHAAGGYAVAYVNQHNVISKWMTQATATHEWMMARVCTVAKSLPDDKVIICRKVRYLQDGDPLELRNVRETLRILETLGQASVGVSDVIFYIDDGRYVSMRDSGLLLPLSVKRTMLECLFHDSVSHRLFGSALFSDVQNLLREWLDSDIRWDSVTARASTLGKGKYRAMMRLYIAYISSTMHNLTQAEQTLIRDERSKTKRGQTNG